jgi:hypothetical protein
MDLDEAIRRDNLGAFRGLFAIQLAELDSEVHESHIGATMADAYQENAENIFFHLLWTWSSYNARTVFLELAVEQYDERPGNDLLALDAVYRGADPEVVTEWIHAMVDAGQNEVLEVPSLAPTLAAIPGLYERALAVPGTGDESARIVRAALLSDGNPLQGIRGALQLTRLRDLIDDLVAGKNIPESRAHLINRLYLFTQPRQTPESLRAQVANAQRIATARCVNESDYVTLEPISSIPAPFIARLPMPNGAMLCMNILDLINFPELQNPITREPLDEFTVMDLCASVRDLVQRLSI